MAELGLAAPAPIQVAAPPPATRPIPAGRRRASRGWLVILVEAVVILAAWQVAVGVLKLVSPVFLPAPTQIFDAFVRLIDRGDLLGHAAYSLGNWLIGYTLGAGLGILLGLLIGGSIPLTRLAGPLVWALYAMPWVAIKPMTTVWFGFGAGPIIFLVFFSSLLPVLINTAAGVRTVDRSLLRAAKVFGAGRVDTWRKVLLPGAVPFVLTGMRLAVITGFIALLVGEIGGSARGLGAVLSIGASKFRAADVFAVIVMVVTLSVSTVWLVGRVERRVANWRPRPQR
jgi:ABC-type nitrate/sulfonate/bicarbonate transport system permease component